MHRLAAGLALVAALATGCGSSPEPTFYALAPTKGAAAPVTLHSVRVRRPGLAGYLDRPDIVRKVAGYRLHMDGSERWGEPLDDMIGRVLVEDLAERCPGATVYGEAGAITAEPDATVEIDVQRFELGASGDVELVAQIAVERGSSHAAASASTVSLTKHPVSAATASLVEAMSALLGELADRTATALRGAG